MIIKYEQYASAPVDLVTFTDCFQVQYESHDRAANPGRFGPGSFRLGLFRPGSFRPIFRVGRFGLFSR